MTARPFLTLAVVTLGLSLWVLALTVIVIRSHRATAELRRRADDVDYDLDTIEAQVAALVQRIKVVESRTASRQPVRPPVPPTNPILAVGKHARLGP